MPRRLERASMARSMSCSPSPASSRSTNTLISPPQGSPTLQAVSSATPKVSVLGWPSDRIASASAIISPSTQPPETEPSKRPSGAITICPPTGTGAEPQVPTTVASATRPSLPIHARAAPSTSCAPARRVEGLLSDVVSDMSPGPSKLSLKLSLCQLPEALVARARRRLGTFGLGTSKWVRNKHNGRRRRAPAPPPAFVQPRMRPEPSRVDDRLIEQVEHVLTCRGALAIVDGNQLLERCVGAVTTHEEHGGLVGKALSLIVAAGDVVGGPQDCAIGTEAHGLDVRRLAVAVVAGPGDRVLRPLARIGDEPARALGNLMDKRFR